MSYFSTEEVDNLKRLREMVTEDLINEIDYADAKDTILAVAKKRRLSAAPKASADSTAESATSSPAASAAPASATPSPSGDYRPLGSLDISCLIIKLSPIKLVLLIQKKFNFASTFCVVLLEKRPVKNLASFLWSIPSRGSI